MTAITSIIWFRNDLRIEDNEALAASLSSGGPVIPAYIWSPGQSSAWPLSPRRRAWVGHSLETLNAQLQSKGSRLVIRSGDPADALATLCAETRAESVFFNMRFDPAGRAEDSLVRDSLAGIGVTVHPLNGSLLFDPESVQTRDHRPYQVFTAFWKQLLTRNDPGRLPVMPLTVTAPDRWPESLESSIVAGERAHDLPTGWTPGETAARRALEAFASAQVTGYSAGRDRPDVAATSRLSPHLAHGEVSPRRVWREIRSRLTTSTAAESSPFLRQLAWREFAHHLLYHFPDTPTQPLKPGFDRWPWRHDPPAVRAWQLGQTGYPLVDAGMRELLATGWMHNRVRMVAASFLTKHLQVSWVEGARWFWHTLLDADLANNTLGWQWVAGCGADAAPYFRVFNPVVQGRKFDPDGGYVRRWIPEIAGLQNRHIHAPWTATRRDLQAAGVALGTDYPEPIVDHAFARQRALGIYDESRRDRFTARQK